VGRTVDRIVAPTAADAARAAAVIRYLVVLILVDLAALMLIGAAILFTWVGLRWLTGW